MNDAIVYSSPFVPPEWIAAHGLRPQRLPPIAGAESAADPIGILDTAEGLCPFVSNFTTCALAVPGACGIVVASTCDQMRRSVEMLARSTRIPVFLMNVPATWQTESARRLYRGELIRLGRFLVGTGGGVFRPEQLIETMRRFDGQRRAPADAQCGVGVRIAMVGGPLRAGDVWIYDLLEQLEAQVVLDATETGQRCLPAPFDEDRMRSDPVEELVRAYFDTIPDAFRRPDTLLHEYLRRHLAEYSVQGVIVLRYAWCDQWHAQVGRLKESMSLPLVEVDLGGRDDRLQRIRTRIESLVSILR